MNVRYISESDPLSLLNGKEYEVISIEEGLYRIIDEEGYDPDDPNEQPPGYLYSPESFVVVSGNVENIKNAKSTAQVHRGMSEKKNMGKNEIINVMSMSDGRKVCCIEKDGDEWTGYVDVYESPYDNEDDDMTGASICVSRDNGFNAIVYDHDIAYIEIINEE
ncbi:MAG: hypothetical protein LIO49_07095 [Ruminococcus sp.]|nr:hypothetical protein [Ruminococcus sp.]